MTEQTLGQPQPNQFTVQSTAKGMAIRVGGEDVASKLAGFDVTMRAGDLCADVTLYVSPKYTHAPEFDGLARVAVADAADPGPAAAEFLSAIDAGELERAALNRLDLENTPGGTTAAMLRQLTEWANGRS